MLLEMVVIILNLEYPALPMTTWLCKSKTRICRQESIWIWNKALFGEVVFLTNQKKSMLSKNVDHWKTGLFSLDDVQDTAALKVDIKELSFDNVFTVCRSGR